MKKYIIVYILAFITNIVLFKPIDNVVYNSWNGEYYRPYLYTNNNKQVSQTPLPQLFNRLSPYVVTIESKNGRGCGVLFGKEGQVLTCYHVVKGQNAITITTLDQKYYDGTIVKYNEERDTAIIQLNSKTLDYPKFITNNRATNDIAIGEGVITIGSPLGYGYTISDGIISGLRDNNCLFQIQHTAPTSNGSSGGPLFSMDGSLLGIIRSTEPGGQNLNFAIPIDYYNELNN